MPCTADDIIDALQLVPLPEEGGFYRETYRGNLLIAESALPDVYNGNRNASTAIYYLVTPDEFSALHRLPSDEVFHFYAGDPVEMLQVAENVAPERIIIGSDILAGQQPQVVAPGNIWQGTRLVPGGAWALLGCTVAPGFDFRDFSLPSADELDRLVALYPDWAEPIRALTPRKSIDRE